MRFGMDYFSGWCTSKRKLQGCVAIVTGSDTGIGKETATDLYLRGARVILACYEFEAATVAKKEMETTNKDVEGIGTLVAEEIDLASLKSIVILKCPEGRTEDGFELQIGINHFGHAMLTLLLLPRLIASKPSRIGCVSSIMHQVCRVDLDDINYENTPYSAFEAYCRSKAANILFAKALALKLQEYNFSNVTTYSLHPGIIRTGIGRNFDTAFWPGGTWQYNNILGLFIKSPRCGAQTTIYCAVDAACEDESGFYYSDCAVKTPSKQCQDVNLALKLWDITIDRLKLNDFNPFISDYS